MYSTLITAITTAINTTGLINKVVHGDIDEVDIEKTNNYPRAHIMVNNGTYLSPAWRFNVTVLFYDLEHVTKDNVNNEDAVYDAMLLAATKTAEQLYQATDIMYSINELPTVEPFGERFENSDTGWALTFDMEIFNKNILPC